MIPFFDNVYVDGRMDAKILGMLEGTFKSSLSVNPTTPLTQDRTLYVADEDGTLATREWADGRFIFNQYPGTAMTIQNGYFWITGDGRANRLIVTSGLQTAGLVVFNSYTSAGVEPANARFRMIYSEPEMKLERLDTSGGILGDTWAANRTTGVVRFEMVPVIGTFGSTNPVWYTTNHPAGTNASISTPTATVLASLSFNAAGHYQSHTTRTLTPANIGAIAISQIGVANGVASLDGNGLVPASQIPALAITETFVVASEAAMLALVAQPGDVAVRTDTNVSYILQGEPASELTNWVALHMPSAETDPVFTASPAFGITGGLISNWNTAFGWGNHATAGYELASNKSTSTSLGTSDVLYPTQNAVKTYVDSRPAPATPSWQQTLAVNHIASIIPEVTRANTLDAGLYANGHFSANSANYPAYGFHRPGNAGMALYLGTVDAADLRIRTSSNLDYKVYHDGYAPAPSWNATMAVNRETSFDPIFRRTGAGTLGIELGREPGLTAFTSGNADFSAWQPLGILSGGLLVSDRAGARPTDDGSSSMQVNGPFKAGNVSFDNGLFVQPQYLLEGSIIQANNLAGSVTKNLYLQYFGGRTLIGDATDDGISALQVRGNIKISGQYTATGAAATYNLHDRTTGEANLWALYADGGNIRVYEQAASLDRLTIETGGNVGVGVTNPATKLHVDGTITAPALQSPSGDNLTLWSQNAGMMFFSVGLSDSRMSIDNSGNVIVGHNAIPDNTRASLLQVEGNVWSTDAYILGIGGTPRGEFGMSGSNVFVRTMGGESLELITGASTIRALIQSTGGFKFNTSLIKPIRTTAVTTTLTINDHTVIANANSITLDVPFGSSMTGVVFQLVNNNRTGVTVSPAMSLDGVMVTSFPANAKWTIQYDGSVWYVINA